MAGRAKRTVKLTGKKAALEVAATAAQIPSVKRTRGRPRKNAAPTLEEVSLSAPTVSFTIATQTLPSQLYILRIHWRRCPGVLQMILEQHRYYDMFLFRLFVANFASVGSQISKQIVITAGAKASIEAAVC